MRGLRQAFRKFNRKGRDVNAKIAGLCALCDTSLRPCGFLTYCGLSIMNDSGISYQFLKINMKICLISTDEKVHHIRNSKNSHIH